MPHGLTAPDVATAAVVPGVAAATEDVAGSPVEASDGAAVVEEEEAFEPAPLEQAPRAVQSPRMTRVRRMLEIVCTPIRRSVGIPTCATDFTSRHQLGARAVPTVLAPGFAAQPLDRNRRIRQASTFNHRCSVPAITTIRHRNRPSCHDQSRNIAGGPGFGDHFDARVLRAQGGPDLPRGIDQIRGFILSVSRRSGESIRQIGVATTCKPERAIVDTYG